MGQLPQFPSATSYSMLCAAAKAREVTTALHKLHSEVYEAHVASLPPANVPTGSSEGGRDVVMYGPRFCCFWCF